LILDPSIGNTIESHGVSFNHYYDITPIGTAPVHDYSQFGIYLTGAFKVGIAIADPALIPSPNSKDTLNLTYYAFMIDFYSLSIVPEYTFVFNNGYALTAKFGFNLVNLGGSVAFPKGGTLNENLIATANIIPLAFSPSLFIDFGRTGLGISFYFNPLNILAYNYVSNGTYTDKKGDQQYYFDQSLKGFKAFSSAMKRYDLQIMFTF